MQKAGTNRCIIFTAVGINRRVVEDVAITDSDFVICADGGISYASKYNVKVDIYIGDFDSGSVESSTYAQQQISLSTDKDYTDTLFAVFKGLELGFTNFVILGGTSGRLSHTISNIYTLKYISEKGALAKIISNTQEIYYIKNSSITLSGKSKYVSIFSVCNISKMVTLDGFLYNLSNATIYDYLPLGVSNEKILPEAFIEVLDGELIVVVDK